MFHQVMDDAENVQQNHTALMELSAKTIQISAKKSTRRTGTAFSVPMDTSQKGTSAQPVRRRRMELMGRAAHPLNTVKQAFQDRAHRSA